MSALHVDSTAYTSYMHEGNGCVPRCVWISRVPINGVRTSAEGSNQMCVMAGDLRNQMCVKKSTRECADQVRSARAGITRHPRQGLQCGSRSSTGFHSNDIESEFNLVKRFVREQSPLLRGYVRPCTLI